jgi:hypothetical protein
MPDPNPVAEEVGKLPEEIDPNKAASPEELGVTGSAEGHDIAIDFGSALDEMAGKIHPKEEDESAEEKPGQNEEQHEQTEEKPAGEKTEVAAPAGAPKKEEPKPEERKDGSTQAERDADLNKFESGLDPHTKPKTRKIIDGIKAEATKARDRAEAAEKARAELEAKAADLEKRVSSTRLPEEVEKEISTLRDLVRQTSIERDPSIVAKYDTKIQANNALVLETLKKAGLPDAQVDALKKSGVTLNNIKGYIDQLESGKGADGKQYERDPETAEALREALRENGRLSKGREQEISEWKSNWEARQKTQQADQEKMIASANERQAKIFGEHVAKFDFLKPPPEPLDSDPPAVKKEKEKARTAFNDVVNKFGATCKQETSDPVTTAITAKVGLMYRDIVVPELMKRLSDRDSRIKELEAKDGAHKKAGAISKTVAPTPGAAKAKPYEPKDFSNDDNPFDGLIDSLASEAASKREAAS